MEWTLRISTHSHKNGRIVGCVRSQSSFLYPYLWISRRAWVENDSLSSLQPFAKLIQGQTGKLIATESILEEHLRPMFSLNCESVLPGIRRREHENGNVWKT